MKKKYSAPAIRCYELIQKQPLLTLSNGAINVNNNSGEYKSQDEFLDE